MEDISVPTSITSDEEFVPDVTNQQSLDSSFGARGCSPVKLVAVEANWIWVT